MLKNIIRPLKEWYQEHKRILYWRATRNPYYIWVSEIMLQQTRVEAVKPYFRIFISEIPSVRELAICPENKLLKLWEGLGYYNRVRNMQKAAITIMNEYGGKIPADYEVLKQLSGIGQYTAGAIASIAYGIPVPAVDGNVLRVLTRILEDSRDISKQVVKCQIEKDLLTIVPKEDPGTFNQALMELGAVVCVPVGRPKCGECPLQELCKAHAAGRELEYPVKVGKKSRRIEARTILLIQDEKRIVLWKRPNQGLLAGMYEFPNLPGHLNRCEMLEWIKKEELTPLQIQKLEDVKYIFSHVEWHMIGYSVQVASFEGSKNGSLILAEKKHMEGKYPVPAAYGAYARYMNLNLGLKKNMSKGKK
ncbi:MAG: A/G-specific adenine glycosylase [Lachnospiraceae bacterium]|nr:A/G-specific adenine glycosylase [Lachnospiraceae bacterium]